MNSSPPLIEVHGDDVTVEASYLAARLGLPVERFRAEMRRGIIYSVVERGMGEDAGAATPDLSLPRARLDGSGRARRDPERGAAASGVIASHQPAVGSCDYASIRKGLTGCTAGRNALRKPPPRSMMTTSDRPK